MINQGGAGGENEWSDDRFRRVGQRWDWESDGQGKGPGKIMHGSMGGEGRSRWIQFHAAWLGPWDESVVCSLQQTAGLRALYVSTGTCIHTVKSVSLYVTGLEGRSWGVWNQCFDVGGMGSVR